MRREDWHDAHLLFAFHCPCGVAAAVDDGLARAPADQPEVVDRWLRLGACVNAILDAVTVQ